MPECGAKTRSGGRCRMAAMKNGRCRMHGGKAGRPPVHNVYSSTFTPEEKARLAQYQARWGNLDHEIDVARIQLERALACLQQVEGKPNDAKVGFELQEQHVEQVGGAVVSQKVTRRRPDFRAIADRAMGRIAHLERIRADLKILEAENLVERLNRMLGDSKAASSGNGSGTAVTGNGNGSAV